MGMSRTITIVNRKGLHARPAASFVKLANQFNCQVRVHGGGKSVDGKSIMEMMLLAASQGARITINTDGVDEQNAIDSLSNLAAAGFDE